MLPCSFSLKISLSPIQAPQRSECPLAVAIDRVFQNSSVEGKLQLCQMNAQKGKKFHRMLLCSFYLKISLFSLQAPQRSECPLAVSTERAFQNCSIKSKLQLCQLNAQNRKMFHRVLLCSFYLKILLFRLQSYQRSEGPLTFCTERVFQNCSIKSKVQLCQLNAQNSKKFH